MGSIFRGISYPFRKGAQEFPVSASDDDLIKESILQILLTNQGDRVMRPDFGSNVLRYVFDPNEAALGDLLWQAVQSALGRWEPRIELLDVRVDRKDESIKVTIDYGVIATRRQGSVSTSVPVPGV